MLNILFVDWWPGFNNEDNFITQALCRNNILFKICKSDDTDVDFVFCSVYGREFINFSCPRVFFSGENVIPDFNVYDYGIGFDEISFGDRYIRYPLYVACYEEACNRIVDRKPMNKFSTAREFCSIVVSNGYNMEPFREELFDSLSKYKRVDSGGRYRNNIGIPQGVNDKLEFISKYKFNIACENVSHDGYCTEKIVEAFAAGTIPIYWGDRNVEKYFNPKAFINCNNFENIEQVVEYIKKIDADDELYMDMLNQKIIDNDMYSIDAMRERFETWLVEIVSQPREKSIRRALIGWNSSNEKKIVITEQLYKEYERKHEQRKRRKSIIMKMVIRVKHAIRELFN